MKTASDPTDGRVADAGEPYDLAIVGYGPTGMTLAALAGQYGHRVVVLERYGDLYNLPRAACFDDEIMRTLQKLGLVEAVRPGTVVQPSYEWVNASGETLLELSYDNPAPGGWAALYMMYQPHLEMVLDRYCKSLPNVTIRQGVTIEAVKPEPEAVTLTGADSEGRRVSLSASYVVGADGGGGFMRNALGIGSSDYGFAENWLVCDFRKRRKLEHVPTFRQVCDPAQPCSIVQIGPDHHRFSFMLEPDEKGAVATDEGRVWERVSGFLKPEDAELVRVANYVFRSRVADRWRSGRIMLAGDAAHEMPPFLAQGMCSGIRDSHNLAWKLDLVLSDRADPRILDTYQPEREPHVRFITERAIELGRVQTMRDPEAVSARDARLLAQRRTHDKPEKLRFPALSAGLIAPGPGAGEFFAQGRVRSGLHEGRFDDIVGQGLCLIARSPQVLAELAGESEALWKQLDANIVVLSAADGHNPVGPQVTEIVDLGGEYEEWFVEHGCVAVLVRPDWYVYGVADDADDLAELVESFGAALRPTAVAP
jgi:2-polyprenyl-6-methoxyphenol hydroxylase-like FAD-dependent oxidoreductase